MSFKSTLFEICNQTEYLTLKELELGIARLVSNKIVTHIAYIIHDKDILEDGSPKPIHCHIMVKCKQVTTSKFIAKHFVVNNKPMSDQFIQKSRFGSYCLMVQYLTHKNDPNKHQYDYADVKKCKGNIDEHYDTDCDVITKPRGVYYAIDWTFQNKSYSQQFIEINELNFGNTPQSTANRINTIRQLDNSYTNHLKYIQMKGVDRDMQVIYITGSAGSGKTLLAKHLAKSMGYDICVSSSSNDPMQDYLGQKALILDDFRQSDWQLSDLLKLLDNHTSSSVKSRYSNKYMNDCKLIIITSINSISNKDYQKYSNEPLQQLYRRINSYVEINFESYMLYEGVNEYGKPKGLGIECENPIKIFGYKNTNTLFDTLSNIVQVKVKENDLPFKED